MYEAHNKQALDALGREGSVSYIHARTTLAVDPDAQMAGRFDAQAHRGLIRKYNNKYNTKLLVADHGPTDRAQFEQCLQDCGYGSWKIQYTT